ncbi:CHAT domain-containing protein [Xylariaceae sp. AK1471]|nr:CHAT domain-containing protein [Xylariaceae sp. AK1471]
MMNALPEGVVVVDYIDLLYSPEDVKRLAILYRRGQRPLFAPIINKPGQVIRWVNQNLAQAKRPIDEPSSAEHLAALSAQVDFVEKEEFFVKEGETLVLCPTGILHRVPLHAIPVGGRPLVERNPVVYCQSLTIFHWLWKRKDGHVARDPVMSTPGIQKLAFRLGASYHEGYPVNRASALNAIPGSHILHYHGHVHYNPNSAVDSIMSLSAGSFSSPFGKRTRPESISARDLFGVRLATPALATIVGCGSGVVAVSSADDVLGLPTALFFAGAGAVVSTLWSIEDMDGETFATEAERCGALGAGSGTRDGLLASMVDLAAGMRETILALRRRTEENLRAPYHWAAFTLNGFHLLPHGIIPQSLGRREPSGESK